MLYGEITAVCYQTHTKHTNTLCWQNVELLDVNLAVHIVTTVFECAKTTNFLQSVMCWYHYRRRRVITIRTGADSGL